jgi:hypothetical protein
LSIPEGFLSIPEIAEISFAGFRRLYHDHLVL